MALKGCYGCLKWLVFAVNLLFWLIGIIVLALSIWLLVEAPAYGSQFISNPDYFFFGVYVLLAVGACMTIVGFLGCCGAVRESQCLLASFFIFLLVILVCQITAAVWAYHNKAELEKGIRDAVKETVRSGYTSEKNAFNEAFDKIQQTLKCCGLDGPKSWAFSAYNGVKPKGAEIGISSTKVSHGIPASCCVNPEDAECENTRNSGFTTALPDFSGIMHEKGCGDALVDFARNYSMILLGVGIGVASVELLGMICSLLLCCAIRKIDDFKA